MRREHYLLGITAKLFELRGPDLSVSIATSWLTGASIGRG